MPNNQDFYDIRKYLLTRTARQYFQCEVFTRSGLIIIQTQNLSHVHRYHTTREQSLPFANKVPFAIDEYDHIFVHITHL